MAPQDILTLARAGNSQVIEALINRLTKPKGISTKVAKQEQCLHVLVESDQALNQEAMVKLIHKCVQNLNVETVDTLKIYGRQIGHKTVDWNQNISLATHIELLPVSTSDLEHASTQLDTEPSNLEHASTQLDTELLDAEAEQAIAEPTLMEPLPEDRGSEAIAPPLIISPAIAALDLEETSDSGSDNESASELTELTKDIESPIADKSEDELSTDNSFERVKIAFLEMNSPPSSTTEDVVAVEPTLTIGNFTTVENFVTEEDINSSGEVALNPAISEGDQVSSYNPPEFESHADSVASADLDRQPSEADFVSSDFITPDTETFAETEPALAASDRFDPDNLPSFENSESEDSDSDISQLLQRPEAAMLVIFALLVALWDIYLELVEDPEVDRPLSGRELARRLGVYNSTISRRKDREDFTQWSQSLDPEGIAWRYQAGFFVPILE
jgi:hypothetical protein